MPTSARRTDASTRRAVAAVAVPLAVAAVAGTLALAAPANAAGSSPALPFPTVCGTATTASGSTSPSATRSATATPKPSASGSSAASPKAGVLKPPNASASPSASSSTSGTSTPSPSPSASSSPSTSGGFWGWLNGVWTWIFGAAQLPPAAAAPAIEAGYVRTGTGTGSGAEAGAARAQSVSLLTAVSASPSPTASCVPSSQVKQNAASSDGNTAAQIPWHLSTPSMTQYSLTYNGITTIKTVGGSSLRVLDFTAAKVTLLSMVTFSHQGGTKLQYVNGGPNQTVTLTGVHLWTTELKANLLGLIPVDYTPDSPPPLPIGLTIPLPLLFTSVEADNAFLSTQSIVIPGFDGHGN